MRSLFIRTRIELAHYLFCSYYISVAFYLRRSDSYTRHWIYYINSSKRLFFHSHREQQVFIIHSLIFPISACGAISSVVSGCFAELEDMKTETLLGSCLHWGNNTH